MKKQTVFRLSILFLALAGIVWFCIPLFWNVHNEGNLGGLFGCALLLLFAAFYPAVQRKRRRSKGWNRAYRICRALLFAGILWSALLTALMASAAGAVPPGEATVVVLGSKVNGHIPSADLYSRIRTAEQYLKAHPDAKCVASGGQGPGEAETEASAIRRYLMEADIAPSRILLEDQSESTQENLSRSLALIGRNGLSRKIAVVTDDYHQFRAGQIARRLGAEPYAVPAPTPWYIFSACYARELLALTKFFILP